MRKQKYLPPCEAIKFRMEQSGRTQTDLAKLLGSRSRASEYISGKRKPSKAHILLLYESWGIPLITLLGAFNIEKAFKGKSQQSKMQEARRKK